MTFSTTFLQEIGLKVMILMTALSAFLLALTHLIAARLKFSYIPRSKWLSFAGGISVTYVFIHILPELAEGQEVIQEKALDFLQHHNYLIALFGLVLFYGMEKTAKQSPESDRGDDNQEMRTNLNVFWVHITSFSLYNAIIGYLLVHRVEQNNVSLLWFTLAMGFHFVVNDYSLSEHYKKIYKSKGRWILTFSVLGGWLVGVLTSIPEIWIVILFAFIAGGTILNVLKEELPGERKSNFWAFLVGIITYSVLILFL